MFFVSSALAGNAGIDREFGVRGIASLRDPGQPPNERFLGLGACAAPGGGLNVVTASAPDTITTFRLLRDGNLDTSFSGDGIERALVPLVGEDAAHAACLSDGRVLIVRMARGSGSDFNIQLLRMTANGGLDTTFANAGSLLIDQDHHTAGLGDWEFPLGLNVDADGTIWISTRIFLSGGASRPGVVRVSPAGALVFARVYETLPGVTPYYASAAGLGPDGRLWLVGGGNPTGAPHNTWFRAEIDPSNGNLIEVAVGTEGNYVVDAGRVLPGGAMVIAGKYVPTSQPGGAYQPRLMVFRETGASHVTLPLPFAVNTFEPTLSPFPGSAVAIPIADGRVLFGSPLGSQDGAYELATYAAVVALGASPAEDVVDTRFGTNGATQFAYRTPTPCANGSPPFQRPVRFSNWLGRPVLAGIHATTCDAHPRNAFAARLLSPEDLFSNGFE